MARHGKPCGFPHAVVRHGCHCTLLFLRRQPSLVWIPKVWCRSYTSAVRVSWSDTHTSDKYSPYCSDHILHLGFGMSGKPDIPNSSAGQGLSSPAMNRSTRHRHSFREVFCRHKEAASRESRHSQVCCAITLQYLLAQCLGVPDGFTYEKAFCLSSSLSLLECFTCFSLHPYSLPLLGFDFGGAKVVKGADDKIPLLYFACLLPAGFPFSLMTRRKPGIPKECTKLFGHALLIFHF